jgi:hypothetical protein
MWPTADRADWNGLKKTDKIRLSGRLVDFLRVVRQKAVVLRTMLTYAMRPHEWGTQYPGKGESAAFGRSV